MDELIEDIIRYLDYLTLQQNLFLSIHGEIVNYPQLARYNFHLHPYCRFIKSDCQKWDVCINRQDKVLTHCKEGAFWGTCYAGMGEYVLPLYRGKELIGFLSASGYRLPDTDCKARHFCERSNTDYTKLLSELNKMTDPPSTDCLHTLLAPLRHMIQSAYKHPVPSDSILYTQLLRYINENCSRNIPMKELTKKFHCSASTLSHQFRKYSGYSIQEYCNIQRMTLAERLLISTDESVAQIANTLDYCTPNYFSDAFKKHTGLSPLQYRKLHKTNG